MSIHKNEAKIYQTEEGTPGGNTFHIILKGDKNPRALCYRPIHNNGDYRCANPAGKGTWHEGSGACKLHGGLAGRPIASGAYAKQAKSRLKESIDKYLALERPKLLDMTEELAFTKAVFQEFTESYPDPDDENYGAWFNRFVMIIGSMGNLVEKISRTDARNALTAAQVLYLRAAITDILLKYIPDPDSRDRALRELASRMGGDVAIDMKASEIDIPRLGGGIIDG